MSWYEYEDEHKRQYRDKIRSLSSADAQLLIKRASASVINQWMDGSSLRDLSYSVGMELGGYFPKDGLNLSWSNTEMRELLLRLNGEGLKSRGRGWDVDFQLSFNRRTLKRSQSEALWRLFILMSNRLMEMQDALKGSRKKTLGKVILQELGQDMIRPGQQGIVLVLIGDSLINLKRPGLGILLDVYGDLSPYEDDDGSFITSEGLPLGAGPVPPKGSDREARDDEWGRWHGRPGEK